MNFSGKNMSCKSTKLKSWLYYLWLYNSGQIICAESPFPNLYNGDDNTPVMVIVRVKLKQIMRVTS